MGGLGANIGSEAWAEAQRKKEQAMQYAETVRKTIKTTVRQRSLNVREQSHREKALEFAKQVPKPKPKKDESLNQINEEEFDEMGNTISMADTNRE